MMSGNGFSIEVDLTKDGVDEVFMKARTDGRPAEFVSSDETKTVVSVVPQHVEGYMLLPIVPPSDLALAQRRIVQ